MIFVLWPSPFEALTAMYKSIILKTVSEDLKVETRKETKFVYEAYVVSISCWDFFFDTLLVSSLKFLDQLERRHCKDTSYFWPSCIRVSKGPFLWRLNIYNFVLGISQILGFIFFKYYTLLILDMISQILGFFKYYTLLILDMISQILGYIFFTKISEP